MTTYAETLDTAFSVLTPSQRDELVKRISTELFSVLGKDGSESARNKILEAENKRLREAKGINDAISDVAEDAIFESRRSKNKIVNLGKRVKDLEKEKVDSAYKLRKALWITSKGIGLSIDNRKKFRKFDKFNVDDWYRLIAEQLKLKMDNSKNDQEKVAIRSMMRQLNKYHEIYTSEHLVTGEERARNMRDIDRSMSSAA